MTRPSHGPPRNENDQCDVVRKCLQASLFLCFCSRAIPDGRLAVDLEQHGAEDAEDEGQGAGVQAGRVGAPLDRVVHGLQERVVAGVPVAHVLVVVVVGVAPVARAAGTVEVVHVDAVGHHAAEALLQRQARLLGVIVGFVEIERDLSWLINGVLVIINIYLSLYRLRVVVNNSAGILDDVRSFGFRIPPASPSVLVVHLLADLLANRNHVVLKFSIEISI